MKQTVGQMWRVVQRKLEGVEGLLPTPREGKMLVAHMLGVEEAALVGMEMVGFPVEKMKRLGALTQRRAGHEPLAYVLGVAPFWGRDWLVREGVLVPRMDTEVLVREALARGGTRVLEVGVGTGCVLGSILLELKNATGMGVDISPEAVAVARENVARAGLEERCVVMRGDGAGVAEGMFDLLVSNPPYIAEAEWVELDKSVRDFEPKMALTGAVENPDGLVFYRRLAREAAGKLLAGGWMCLEVGWQQAAAVRDLLQQEEALWCDVSIALDLAGRGRVVSARRV